MIHGDNKDVDNDDNWCSDSNNYNIIIDNIAVLSAFPASNSHGHVEGLKWPRVKLEKFSSPSHVSKPSQIRSAANLITPETSALARVRRGKTVNCRSNNEDNLFDRS